MKIDFDGIDQRVLALPVPRNYTALFAGKEGVLFVLESAPVLGFGFEGSIVHRFDLDSRKTQAPLTQPGVKRPKQPAYPNYHRKAEKTPAQE